MQEQDKYFVAAVHFISREGGHSLTIRSGVAGSADLLIAQATAQFCAERPGFVPAAVISSEIPLSVLESVVAILNDGILPKGFIPRRRGRRPGRIPAKQEPLSGSETEALNEYPATRTPAWGKPGKQDSAPGHINFDDELEPPDELEDKL